MKLSTLASRLRHRITLQQEVLSADGAGGWTKTWSTVATLWAKVIPVDSIVVREKLGDERLQAASLCRISLRYRTGITSAHRILFGTRVLNIRSVTIVDEANAALELLCEEGVAL